MIKDTVKVELRQENRDRKAGKVPAVLEIRAPEDILDVASDYEVSLLKFVTGFDVPILHIPEDKPVKFMFYENGRNAEGTLGYYVRSEAIMSGTFNSISEFCDSFNRQHKYKGQQTFTMSYDPLTTSITITCLYVNEETRRNMFLAVNEECLRMFKNHFYFDDKKYRLSQVWEYVLYDKYKGNPIFRPGKTSTTVGNVNSIFYNFDYIQLGTDLPIAKTLTTTSGHPDRGLDSVYKMPTLGTVAANSMVQDAYAKGGLLYLPNFKVTSSLRSDLPLKNFKIAPHIFYKTGHYEQVVLAPGSTCYALVEFSPRG